MELENCQRITKEIIFQKISPYDIYKMYVSGFHERKTIKSPLRTDKHPSWGVFSIEGKLLWKDIATGDSGDCIRLVERMYGLNYPEALEKIAKDFFITAADSVEYKKITSTYEKPVIEDHHYCDIKGITVRWQPHNLKYWSNYLIDVSELKRENIYPLKEVILNKQKVYIKPGELVYGYYYPGVGWKVMFPERHKTEKWLSNIPLTYCEGLKNLHKDHNALIAKSTKCRIVALKVYPYTCSFQNESLGSVTDETDQYIKDNSTGIWYWGDSDMRGKEASYKITGKYGYKHINCPDCLLPGVKDISDWSKAEQEIKQIENHLRKKGVIL